MTFSYPMIWKPAIETRGFYGGFTVGVNTVLAGVIITGFITGGAIAVDDLPPNVF